MTTISPAEERLLDIALDELLADANTKRRSGGKLLVAGVCLIAIAIVMTFWWEQRGAAPQASLEEPQTTLLPPPVRADSPAALKALPASATNLEYRVTDPGEFRELRRFRDLRRLRVDTNLKIDGDEAARARFDDAAAFASLGDLNTLQALELVLDIDWTPEHFAFLRNLRLQEFRVWVVDLRSRAMADALLAAPTFRALGLVYCRVNADLFAALQPLRLRRLELRACTDLDEDAWAAIARLHTLQHLEVTYMDGGQTRIRDQLVPAGSLADPAFDAIASLPELRHLALFMSGFPGDLLQRLPLTLTSLNLGDRQSTYGDMRMLRRLTGLRSLTFGCGLEEKDAAAVLSAWTLEHLDYRGELHGPMLTAIVAQPRLRELALRSVSPRTNLAPLVDAPNLRELDLGTRDWSGPGIAMAQLAPLVACKELRVLRIHSPKGDASALREMFGERVAVELNTGP